MSIGLHHSYVFPLSPPSANLISTQFNHYAKTLRNVFGRVVRLTAPMHTQDTHNLPNTNLNATQQRSSAPHSPPTSTTNIQSNFQSVSSSLSNVYPCKHNPTKSKPSFLRLLEGRGQTQQCTQSTTHKHLPLVTGKTVSLFSFH